MLLFVGRGTLPGEVRKDFNKGPRKTHQPRTDANGKIRGREFDRHVSGTGRMYVTHSLKIFAIIHLPFLALYLPPGADKRTFEKWLETCTATL